MHAQTGERILLHLILGTLPRARPEYLEILNKNGPEITKIIKRKTTAKQMYNKKVKHN